MGAKVRACIYKLIHKQKDRHKKWKSRKQKNEEWRMKKKKKMSVV